MRLSDLWRGRGRTIPPDRDYPTLEGVIESYLHQDMDLFHETISEAIAECATLAEPRQRAMLIEEIDRFLAREAADPDAAFVTRWGFDVNPSDIGRSSTDFLNAVRAIAVDPAAASDCESATTMRGASLWRPQWSEQVGQFAHVPAHRRAGPAGNARSGSRST